MQNPFVQLLQGFSGDFIKKNPLAVRKYMEDFVTVANYVKDPANRTAVIAATTSVTKIPGAVLDKFLLTDDDFYRPVHGAGERRGAAEKLGLFPSGRRDQEDAQGNRLHSTRFGNEMR